MVDNTVSNKQMTVIYNKELLKNEKKNCFFVHCNDSVIYLTQALMEKLQSRNLRVSDKKV